MDKITANSAESKSKDLTAEIKEQIFSILPECNIDGQLDTVKLISILKLNNTL